MTTEPGFIQKLTRLYTFYSPLRKGKYRLAQASLRMAGELPGLVKVRTRDGRTLEVDFRDHLSQLIYFIGEYERPITEIVRAFVRPGSICLDVGANIGWYTTLMQVLAGPGGEVHAFEPVPGTFSVLSGNVASNRHPAQVALNNVALGESAGTVTMHTFGLLADGHASLSDFGDSAAASVSVPMIVLDHYLEEKGVGPVDFVKIDIEGAELSMLKGSARLFAQERPPVIVVEAALETTRGFGYVPDDIVKFLRDSAAYDFFEVGNEDGKLRRIEGFAPDSIGANVLCVPKDRYPGERAILGIS